MRSRERESAEQDVKEGQVRRSTQDKTKKNRGLKKHSSRFGRKERTNSTTYIKDEN